MLQALAERAVQPDLLIRTSAGAVTAAYIAGYGMNRAALDRLADAWRGRRGEEVLLSAGEAVSAVLASAAIAGVLPLVERAGPTLVDGGVADNDFSHAGELSNRAHHATARWIDQGGPLFPNPERFLSLHDHTYPLPGRQSVNV
jgi:hypothetical protein